MNSHFLGQHSPKLQELLQKFYKESNDSSSLNLASDWADLVGGPEMGVAKRVAIEADGPWHYAANCPHTLGKTLLKRRVLRAQGWTVVSVGLQHVTCPLFVMLSLYTTDPLLRVAEAQEQAGKG